jgi:hypothetical protein
MIELLFGLRIREVGMIERIQKSVEQFEEAVETGARSESVMVEVLFGSAQSTDLMVKNIFAIGTESSFPIEFRQGMILVPVRVNGSRPLSFALDTGSTRMLVDRALASGLGLKPSGKGSLQGAGAGRIPIEFLPNVDLGFPGLESKGLLSLFCPL